MATQPTNGRSIKRRETKKIIVANGNAAPSSSSSSSPHPPPTTTTLTSSLLLSTIPQWSWILSLIFVGCCSNAYYLETSTSQIPNLGTLITFLQFLSTMLLALPSQIERRPSPGGGRRIRWKKNNVPLSRWTVQVLLYASTTLLNNIAFAYDVPMPVHIIFRSGGLVVNMLMGWLVRGKRYSLLQIISVLLVTFGVILSTISTSPSNPTPTPHSNNAPPPPQPLSKYFMGISLLFLALFLSSLMGIWQEITFQRYGRDNWQEAIFYSHALSMPLLALRASSLVEETNLALASPTSWIGINSPLQDKGILNSRTSRAGEKEWPPPGGIWDLTQPLLFLMFPFKKTKADLASHLPSCGVYIPSILPLLFLNVLTQLVCINGVNRLTSKVSSVGVTLVLVVRKAISLAISVLLVGGMGRGKTGGDGRILLIGASAVGIGTVGYAWASSSASSASSSTSSSSRTSTSTSSSSRTSTSTTRRKNQIDSQDECKVEGGR